MYGQSKLNVLQRKAPKSLYICVHVTHKNAFTKYTLKKDNNIKKQKNIIAVLPGLL